MNDVSVKDGAERHGSEPEHERKRLICPATSADFKPRKLIIPAMGEKPTPKECNAEEIDEPLLS